MEIFKNNMLLKMNIYIYILLETFRKCVSNWSIDYLTINQKKNVNILYRYTNPSFNVDTFYYRQKKQNHYISRIIMVMNMKILF